MIVDDNETSGAVVLRAALWARRSQLANIARDCNVSGEALHAFLSGSKLAPAVLEALTKRIWNGSFKYDHVSDKLEHTNKAEPHPAPVTPLPYVPPGPKVDWNKRREDIFLARAKQKPPEPSAQYSKPGWIKRV